jgi:transcriptional regulator with XRE-family HTH domain
MPARVQNRHLIDAREARGLTRSELAAILGVSEAWIYQLEEGWRNPSLTTLLRIADALECPLSDLDPRIDPGKLSENRSTG